MASTQMTRMLSVSINSNNWLDKIPVNAKEILNLISQKSKTRPHYAH